MRLFVFPLLPLVLATTAPAAFAGSPPADTEAIMALLPPGMEDNLIDPLTVAKRPTFATGEQLKFKLGWSLFTVARAELSVEPGGWRDRHALKIRLDTRTNAFADAFYKVRNTSASWVAPDLSRSFQYITRQLEGGDQRDVVAVFEPEERVARYRDNLSGEERDPVAILPGSFDPLGIVFFVRSLDFAVGDELVIPTSNGKEFFYTIVRVVDKVERKFALGRREAWVLEPDIKDVGGVFKRSPDGSIRFYFSADADKLPLRMESEVAVGSFWADLVEIGE
jgi:hypothetical protein